jgi:hypothetical protein
MSAVDYAVPNEQSCHCDCQAKYEKVCQERDRWKAEADRWRARYAWQRDLLAVPATQLSPSEKLAALALYPTVQNQRDRGQAEPEIIYIPELAERAGLSAQTFGTCLKRLEDAGGIDRRVSRDPDTKHRRVSITATDRYFEAPATLQPPTPRNHGGQRQVCPECGSDRLTVRTRIVCEDCGTYHDEPPRPVNLTYEQDEHRSDEGPEDPYEAQTYGDLCPISTEYTERADLSDNGAVTSCIAGDDETYVQDEHRSEANSHDLTWVEDESLPNGEVQDPSESVEPQEPAWLPLCPGGLPEELLRWRRFMTWKPERAGMRWDKPPRDARTGYRASKTDPSHWSTFAQAIDGLGAERTIGLGFIVNADDPFCFVDLDRCRDPETGTIEEWAREIIRHLDSYTEASPSGRGIRIIVKGALPPCGRKRGSIEMYDNACSFLTLTGHRIDGTPATIEDRQPHLLELHRSVFGERPKVAPLPAASPLPAIADEQLIERAHAARNGAKFTALWRGDWAGYPSQSEADLALCRILSFWGAGHEQLDRLFRRSGLYRPEKWDRTHHSNGQTYGQGTIDVAVSGSQP